MHKWLPSHTTNDDLSVTFVWIDPANIVAGSYEVKIEPKNSNADSANDLLVYHHKPSLRQPLRPGVWRLLLLHNWIKYAETRFVITPLLYRDGLPLTDEQLFKVHNGPAQSYSDHNFTAVEILLRLHEAQSLKKKAAETNARKSGLDLTDWIKDLVRDVWTVQDICLVNHTLSSTRSPYPWESPPLSSWNQCISSKLKHCQHTTWSSHFPDPKSYFPYPSD